MEKNGTERNENGKERNGTERNRVDIVFSIILFWVSSLPRRILSSSSFLGEETREQFKEFIEANALL